MGAWQRTPKPPAALLQPAGRLPEDCRKLPAACRVPAGSLPADFSVELGEFY